MNTKKHRRRHVMNEHEQDRMYRALVGRNSTAALELIVSAWEEGNEIGIESELMAYAALYTALGDLVATFGEEPVAVLSERLAERVRAGEFTFYATVQ